MALFACIAIGTTCPAATARVIVWPPGPVTVTLTVFDWGFETTTANGPCCASLAQTRRDWHVVPPGQVCGARPSFCGSHWPRIVPPPIIVKQTLSVIGEPCVQAPFEPPHTSIALSRSAAQYSQPM